MSASPAADKVDLALVLVLHAPYVDAAHRRAGRADPLGEMLWSWVAESLLPLLSVLERLEREQVEAPLSVAISPLLCEMLADIEMVPALTKYLERGWSHAQQRARLCGVRGQNLLREAATFWEAWYTTTAHDVDASPDVLGVLRTLAARGRIELLATPATLAPLPLLSPRSVQVQISLAAQSHQKYFGERARGLWLCRGWEDEAGHVARAMEMNGFEFVVEGAPTTRAFEVERDPATRYHAAQSPRLREALPPIDGAVPEDDFAPFLRGGLGCLRPHAAASEQAWHPSGYAGDEHFLHAQRREHPGALRLWRNTGEHTPLSMMEAYQADATPAVCEAQAAHWLDRVHEWAQRSSNVRGCVALDASLLGASWFEGHAWLGRVLRRAASDPRFDLRPASHAFTLGALHSLAPAPEADGSATPDGPTLWRNKHNFQMWDEVAECEATLEHLASAHVSTENPKLREILSQCARELLLIQSGDWPLLLTARPPEPTREDDAHNRLATHLESFRCLASIAETVADGGFMSEGQRAYLNALSERDDVFADASFALWSRT